ncbi:MAG: indole-3-glycerol phosphate synthase TrpC [Deltaproteobacteria bacterium]|nr:indole-3-glycerol phosphate synthase TrpC [Deltaproteobacteria bacterium]
MILDHIVAAKHQEVASLKANQPLSHLKGAIKELPPTRDFRGAISNSSCSIIAEVKRSSPSKGRIREEFDPVQIAAIYQANGARAISVLTDEQFFEGKGAYLSQIKDVIDLPLLRKDFIIDPYQIYETRLLGGDALLLIASLLEEGQLREYIQLAKTLRLAPLVEVHTKEELAKALTAGADIIGINNRDLKTFATDIQTTLELASLIPGDRTVVTESGIVTRGDIERLMDAGVHCFLIGETLMRAEDIGGKLRELLGGAKQ